MRSNKPVGQILDLLHDAQFKVILYRASESALTRSAFDTLTMPAGYTPDDTWRVLTAFRRQTALVIPVPAYVYDHGPVETWCSINRAINRMLTEVITTSRMHFGRPDDAPVDDNRYSYAAFLAKDIRAALLFDGVSVSEEIVNALILMERTPRNFDEQIASNLIAIIFNVERYLKKRITPWTIEDIAGRIEEGCEGHFEKRESPLAEHISPNRFCSNEEIIETLCAILAKAAPDADNSYLIELLNISSTLWEWEPLDRWNGAVELVLRHIGLAAMGLPELGYVPIAWNTYRWIRSENGETIKDRYWDVEADIGEGYDETATIQHALEMILGNIAEMRASLAAEHNRNAPLLAEIEVDHKLNRRQAHILKQIIANPRHRIKVASHMRLYGIAYATARSDLLGLVEMGHLDMHYESRAMVFTASAQLTDKLNRSVGGVGLSL